ncbi:MAG: hypothetical protein U0529_03995 [Thermoanaerobaculia bacterium]
MAQPESARHETEADSWFVLGIRGMLESAVQPEKYFSARLPVAAVVFPFLLTAVLRVWLAGVEMQYATVAIAASVPPEVAARTDWASEPLIRSMGNAAALGGCLASPSYAMLFSGLMFLICCARGHVIDFRAAFVPTSFATSAFALKRAFVVLLLWVKGTSSIRGAADLEPLVGLGLLSPGPDMLRHALDAVNVFDLWGLLIIAVGLSAMAALSRREAAICSVATWGSLQLVSLLFRVAVKLVA